MSIRKNGISSSLSGQSIGNALFERRDLMMKQKKVTTKGSYQDMEQVTNLNQQTIQGAIDIVEKAANIEVEVPEEK